MSISNKTEIPSQTLARQIVERLVKEGLISSQSSGQTQSKLADGKLTGEDWRLLIELGSDKEGNQ